MKREYVFYLFLMAGMLASSCKKEIKDSEICLHDSSVNYFKRWAAVLTVTEAYNNNGDLIKRTIVHPNGYFQINSDFTYSLYSDAAPVNGKWSINANCQFVLNANTFKERKFSVIKLSADSLTIRQTENNITTTQHYASFTCPELSSLQFRWDNAFTVQASYSINADTVYGVQYLRPAGYFKLNPDASYNVFVGTVNSAPFPAPTNGTWGIAQPGCLLILDKNKPGERSYEVQKLTADSLVIWRKDTIAKVNFLNHYSKHK